MLLFLLAAPVEPGLGFSWDITGSLATHGFHITNELLRNGALNSSAGGVISANVTFHCTVSPGIRGTLTLSTEGPSRYGLLLDGSRETLYGTYGDTQWSDLAPFIDTAAITVTPPGRWSGCRAGLLRWLPEDKYGNPGMTVMLGGNRFSTELHYSWRGYRRRFYRQPGKLEDLPNIPKDVRANFFGVRSRFQPGAFATELRVEYLVDTTPVDSRWNFMAAGWGDVDRDELGTVTLGSSLATGRWRWHAEGSRNWGFSRSVTGEKHRYMGFRLRGGVQYRYGIVQVSAVCFFASGQPRSGSIAADGEKNFKGFVVYPPTDIGLLNSHYRVNADAPPVMSGGTATPFYGVPRPSVIRDAYAFENLAGIHPRIRLELLKNVSMTFDGWWLRLDEAPEVFAGNAWKRASRNLGEEYDIEAVWRVTGNVQLRGFWGIFLPGAYYRDAAEGIPVNGLPAPRLKVHGHPVQLFEMGIEAWL